MLSFDSIQRKGMSFLLSSILKWSLLELGAQLYLAGTEDSNWSEPKGTPEKVFLFWGKRNLDENRMIT